ncbi:fasciclin-like arabinogalactan protein 6 [Ananas comosus]|uniref:Fasciclin-like arabinogalactan protein 6 n=1 Tax=Ananas comosus TaxID=4615 RepID=A0A6P5EWD3_ANACO|nr:fasciclin-like arabinogalactan protein 6 [Ananas comosus]
MAPAHFLLLLLLPLASPTLFAVAATVAPGPTPAPLNLTGILDKGGQYTTLLRLLKETQVGQQLTSQLNSSFDGLTLFAPTDNAFSQLKPGTLNTLTAQQQVELVLYHVLPRFYSLTTFQMASNPLRTQASGNNGVYTVNVTSTSNQVNVSTGVNQVVVSNVLHSDFPLAVYSLDNVLLPFDLFGVKPPAAAPAPDVAPKKKPKKAPADSTASGPAAADATASGAGLKRIGWGFIAGVGFMGIMNLL